MLRKLTVCGLMVLMMAACGDNNDDNNDGNHDDNHGGGGGIRDTSMDQAKWQACVDDKMRYEQFEETISSIARVQAFGRIGEKLWENPMTPTADDFALANAIYVEEEGIDSRVSRREDEHYDPVMEDGEKLRCRDEGVPQKDPDRCVGPAQIRPAILDAFTTGGMGMGVPEALSAEIEAELLHFFYISSYKEAVTCSKKKKDCDSSFAYYAGGEQVDGGIGLAAYYKAASPEAHKNVFDGLYALNCWREVDSDEEAVHDALHEQALAQLGGALDAGLAAVLVARLDDFESNTGTQKEADWAFVQALGPVLHRAASQQDATKADALAALWTEDAATADAAAARRLIEDIF